jgi:hypothetical protein
MNKHLKISRALSNTMLNLLMVGIGFCSASLAQPGTDLFKQHHALMIAAIRNNEVERVKALLKTPYVLINDPAYEISYLAEACGSDAASDKSDIVKVLLDAGADVKWRTHGSYTLFHQLATNARQDPTLGIIIDALRKDTGGVSSPTFKDIINMQTNSLSGMPSNTALYVLADRTAPNQEEDALFVAKLLIETALADPNIPGHLDLTPLALARLRHANRLAQYLEQHGAH